MKSIVFTGGGTGGHIYPGLAVADEFSALCAQLAKDGIPSDYRLVWIGSSKGMDRNLVEKSGSVDRFIGIPSGKLRRYVSLKNITDVFRIAGGFFVSLCVLLKIKPAAVFSKGGFVSVPPCAAAKLLRIPVYTHECDLSPGLATKIISRFADNILLSFPNTPRFFSKKIQQKLIATGNPVRPVFYTATAEKGRAFLGLPEKDTGKPVLLVLGGSLGAKQINDLVAADIEWLCSRFIVVHQTGAGNSAAAVPETNAGAYKPYPFIFDELPDVMAAADIVLSRAGSNFLWECAVTGKPLVLVPLAGNGSRGDQVENAEWFRSRSAAAVLSGNDADTGHLRKILENMRNPAVRKSLSRNIQALVPEKKPALRIAEILFAAAGAGGIA